MDSKPSNLRLFYALWPDAVTRAALARQQTGLQGRKTALQNLHLTLAFLGSRPLTALPVLKQLLTRLDHPAFKLQLDRVGYFQQKQIAWLGMCEVPDALLALQHGLMQQLAGHDISINQHARFKPHVTLARDEAQAPADILIEPIQWHADTVVLVESATQGGASCYRVLATHRLADRTRI